MAYGDPYDPTAPQQGGGLLNYFGNVTQNPLFGVGLGLLANTGPSLTPKAPLAGLVEGLNYTNQAQEAAQKNAYMRAKLAESAKEAAGQEAFAKAIESGGTDALGFKLPAGMNPAAAAGLFRVAPKEFINTVFPDPVAQSTMALNQAQLMKLQREAGAETGQAVHETVTTLGNIKTISDMSQRLDDSPFFAPGGIVDQWDAAPMVGSILKGAKAMGVEVPQGQIDAASDLATLSKATTSMANNLQSQGSNLPRSSASLAAVQTAAAAKMPWAAKREMLVPNLQAIIRDAEEQGIQDKIPAFDEIKQLTAEMAKQRDAYNAKRNADVAASRGAGGQPPVVTPAGVPGVSTQPNMTYAPPAVPTGPPTLGAADGNLNQQPGTQLVTTTPQAGTPQKTPPVFPQAINPRTQQPERVWPRPTDAERAIKAQHGPDAVGMTFIAINPQTKRPQLYTITENNKGTLR